MAFHDSSQVKTNIFEKTVNVVKSVFVWLLFLIFCCIMSVWVAMFILYDWKVVLMCSMAILFIILKGTKKVFDYLNGKDDEKLNISAYTTPLKSHQNSQNEPPPVGVGEDGLKIDIKDAILTHLELYGSINIKNENEIKRIQESVIFRNVPRGEIDHCFHVLLKNSEIIADEGKIYKKSMTTGTKELIQKDIPKKIWNIAMLCIRIHGFEKWTKEAEELFAKYPISEYDNLIEKLTSHANEVSTLVYSINRREKKIKKQDKPKPKEIPKPIQNPRVPIDRTEQDIEQIEEISPRLRKLDNILRITKEIDEEFERKVKELKERGQLEENLVDNN